MLDSSPEDLDKLFQVGSEQHDFEYNEVAWEQMEQLLDKKKKKRSFIWVFTGLLSLITVVGIITYTTKSCMFNKLSLQEQNDQNSFSLNQNIEIEKAIISNDLTSIEQIQEEVAPPISITKDSIISNKIEKIKALKGINSSHSPRVEDKASANSVVKKINNIIDRQNNIIGSTTTREIIIEETLTNNAIIEKQSQETKVLDLVAKLPNLNASNDLFNTEEIIEGSIAFNTIDPIKEKKNNYFTLSLVAGVESNTVEESAFCVPKGRIGLHLDSYFANKFAVSIGANFSKKKYVAQGESYKAPKGFWSKGTVPETVKAHCDVLEIPIYVSFFSNGYANKSWYITAGLNTFFMLEEQYQYRYKVPDASLRQKWSTQNTNRHFFSLGEISTGYHIPFANKSSLAIGSYLQLPITGIGHGQIKVLTVGVNAKYSFRVGR